MCTTEYIGKCTASKTVSYYYWATPNCLEYSEFADLAVFAIGGGFGFNPPPTGWGRPLMVTVKFGPGVGFDPNRKVKNPNSSLSRYKLSESSEGPHKMRT